MTELLTGLQNSTTEGREAVLSVRGLSKSYPGVKALIDLDLDIVRGEVHAIVGQNGAGKSTFIRMLSGADRPNAGTIHVDGTSVKINTPHDAQRAGVFTIYQELSLVPQLSVAENIFIGDLPRSRWGGISRKALRTTARTALAQLGFEIDVDRPVQSLPVAHQQAIEIAKVMHRQAKVILLDEPTATLPKPDVQRLFAVLRGLQEQGVTLIYISHRLEEVYEICQRITVFRDGRKIDTYRVAETAQGGIVRAMLGRELSEGVAGDGAGKPTDTGRTSGEMPTSPPSPGGRRRRLGGGAAAQVVVLSAEGLSDGKVLFDVNLTLHEGEVLGVTGLAGNGQAELAACLFGAREVVEGRISVRGKATKLATPRNAIGAGIGLLPEERKTQGLVLGMSVTRNVTMASLGDFSRYTVLQRGKERRAALAMRQSLSMKVDDVDRPVATLSGGNQQKVVLAKWLLSGTKILVFDEPTRGVDIGAKAEMYELIRVFARQGGSVLLITSELEEALMCDRVLVLARGTVVGNLDRHQFEGGDDAILDLCTR